MRRRTDAALVGRLRDRCCAGPLLARGAGPSCAPGATSGAPHDCDALDALEAMGARKIADRHVRGASGWADLDLSLRGVVTGTETALLPQPARPASPRSHAACEPHVVSCASFAQLAWVSGAARRRSGSKAVVRCGAEHRLWATTSKLALAWSRRSPARDSSDGARAEDMEVVAAVLKRMQIACSMEGRVHRGAVTSAAAGRITTSLWPDFQRPGQPRHVLATQAEVRRWSTTGCTAPAVRARAVERMSADLFLCDPHRSSSPPRKLRGRPLDSRDLRSGMR